MRQLLEDKSNSVDSGVAHNISEDVGKLGVADSTIVVEIEVIVDSSQLLS